ncbi:MAG: sirohydrochlorin chelatase [Rhodospirillales bacterium]|nr:sirohydrochlorin chelatase [Rhodospirillales bacterium]
MDKKTAIMICGHGSRNINAITQFNQLSVRIKERLPQYDIESGFLEFAKPVLRTGLDKLKERGAERIICLPGMLFAAGHVKNDLPSEVNEFAHANPDLDVRFARELAIDFKLLKAAQQRIQEALESNDNKVDPKDTLLMVVGRGTNDPDANSNVCKVTRMLWEGMGFGWAETCYSGVAFPRVDGGLEQAAKLGYKRIIVFPYFLFTGILVDRIYDQTDEVAANHPDIEFVKAGYLNDHDLVIDTFVERFGEVMEGDNKMNCQLCKYREQVIGYEDDVAAPQQGHHHHVRGAGTDDDHGHHHHDHGHHHHHHDE